eukprot:801496-Pyramimonas_sp.AAC.1
MVPLHATSPCIAKLRARREEIQQGHLLCRDLTPTQLTWLRVQEKISLLSWVEENVQHEDYPDPGAGAREDSHPCSEIYKLLLGKGAR